MSYEVIKVYDIDDTPIGYAVRKGDTFKLEGSNIWTDYDELTEYVANLNKAVELQKVWPDANDPEVQELILDDSFEPLEYIDHETVDQEKLYELVMQGKIRVSSHDHDVEEKAVDPRDVHLVPKTIEPGLKNPSQPMERYRRACEIVAHRRLDKAHSEFSL